MTNGERLVVKKDSKSDEHAKKEKIPYTLPSDAQLLAYWHYQNSAQHAPDLWYISHKQVGPEDGATRKRDEGANLIRELRGQGARTSFSKSRYVHDIRLLSKWRLVVGLKRDGCIQLDQQLDIEQKKYLEIKREYKECVGALEQFLERDYDDSMRVLSQADAELARTIQLSQLRDELSHRYGQVRLQVYHWEEAWRTVKACQRFLHRISPLGQPDDEEDEEVAEDEKDRLSSGVASAQGSYTMNSRKNTRPGSATPRTTISGSEIGNATSLESLIAAFEKEASGLAKSPARNPRALGLLEADDLLRLFRTIELQNLNALIHLESLGGPMADMIARIDVAEVRVRREIDDVLEGIKHLEASIVRDERRAQLLERNSARLVQRNFRALVCSEEALLARVLVEEAYESCVAPNEAGLDALSMTRTLESSYEQLSSELDGLPRHLVLACERDGFRQEMKETREAEDAAKKFELMQRLLGALRRLMEPTEPRRRVLMRRSLPRTPRSKGKAKRKTETEAAAAAAAKTSAREALHLDFFGKLCKPGKKDQGDDASGQDEDNA